jgi:hypothetical protein
MKATNLEQDQPHEEETIVISFRLTRGLVAVLIAALLAVAVLGYLTLGQKEVSASPAEAALAPATGSSGLRQYYRTFEAYSPTQISLACSTGYHFASLWEILDTSNLAYNSVLGDYQADSGSGPLTSRRGWVRTGYNSDSSGFPGMSNCLAWTSDSFDQYGTSAELTDQWGDETTDVGTWIVGNDRCDIRVPVWCVED